LDLTDAVAEPEARFRYTESDGQFRAHRCEVDEITNSEIELFLRRKLRADVVVTNFEFSSPYRAILQYEAASRFRIPQTVPIVTYFDETLGLPVFSVPAAAPQLALASLAGRLAFNTERAKTELIRRVRPTFSPTFLKDLIDSPVIQSCIDSTAADFEAIRAKSRQRRKENPEAPLLFFNASPVGANRNYDVLISAFQKALSTGRDFKWRLYTQLDSIPSEYQYPFLETRAAVSRGVLHTFLHESDVVYDGTTVESGLFLHESVLSRALPLFFKDKRVKNWVKERIPPDYPFIATTETELAAMITTLIDEFDSDFVTGARESVYNFTRESMDQAGQASKWLKFLVATVLADFDPKKYVKSPFGDLMLSIRADEPPPMSSVEIGRLAQGQSKSGTFNPQKALSPVAFRRLMQSCGFRDIGDDEELWEPGYEPWVPEGDRVL
jgi:hypothetical protein